ncbi:MAG: Wzz/FepE/Etk N-terminal domain-containing protein [Oscillospiraceae bacterium]|nr:Wzz/FepE/Etk N-terminal domain-containing protein [Oscillospiraceae bacterium]MDD3832369.1 Wzz/FepE/Etk N-terminal domain-containing protein [Oscillospiraceae bacterium]MDD4546163.1 Wzz/FepE/Etk N-terminal domain-containing protein [Oscillospiraceae bacterium]
MNNLRFDMKVIFFILNKLWISIVAIVAGGLLALFISVFLIKPRYASFFTLCIRNAEQETDRISSADIYASQLLLPSCATIIESNTVLKTVAEKLGDGTTVEELQKYISISTIEETNILKITVITSNAKFSYEIGEILATVAPPLTKGIMKVGMIEVLDMPFIIYEPYQRNHYLHFLIGTLSGLSIGAAIIFVLYNFDTTIKDVDDLWGNYKLPILGEVPFYDGSKDEKEIEA